MQGTLILHCEDNAAVRRTVEEVLHATTAHRVVDSAPDRETAFVKLGAVKAGQLAINTLLLDGNLKRGGKNDPGEIIKKAEELGLTIAKVGLSSNGLAEKGLVVGREIDADIIKTDPAGAMNLLAKALDDLPEPEPRTS